MGGASLKLLWAIKIYDGIVKTMFKIISVHWTKSFIKTPHKTLDYNSYKKSKYNINNSQYRYCDNFHSIPLTL